MVADRETRRRGVEVRWRVLEAARQLFGAQGINATGMEQVAACAPVSKRTLYAYFPTKQDLALAYLIHLRDNGLTVEAVLNRVDLSPRDRVLSLFSRESGFERTLRGCPFLNAAIEFPDPTNPVHVYAVEQKRRFDRRLGELARDAGAVDHDSVGQQLAILSDGLSTRVMVLDDGYGSRHAKVLAGLLLDRASTPELDLIANARENR